MRVFFMICVAVLVAGWTGVAAEGLRIELRTVGNVDKEVVVRLQDWVGGNIGPVKDEGALKIRSVTLEEIVREVPQPKEARQLVLVLVDELKGETRHVAHSGKVVAVQTGIMKLSDMKAENAKETFLRRLEKESVGALAVAYGLPVCPMIRCAAYAASTAAEVDEKSRGLCPPCMQRLEDLSK